MAGLLESPREGMTFKAQDMAEGETSGTESDEPSRSLPPMVAEALAPAKSVEEAEAFCARLARQHYENFSVVSVLLPANLKQDFCNVYAFCRTADDLGDEIHDADVAITHLENLAEQTRKCFAGQIENTLFVALSGTIKRHEIPIQPFLDLIDAFEQDRAALAGMRRSISCSIIADEAPIRWDGLFCICAGIAMSAGRRCRIWSARHCNWRIFGRMYSGI